MERKLSKLASTLGREATFGSAEEEVKRILDHKTNYYVVLKVTAKSEESEIKYNYLRLSRLVHPDKCKAEGAGEASAVLNQSKDTLMNPLKKTLYDAYLDDTAKGTGQDEKTYAEWEASNAMRPVQVPAWLQKVLEIKVVGQVVALLLIIILIPIMLIVVAIGFVMWLLCLPFNLLFRCCCPDRFVIDAHGTSLAPVAYINICLFAGGKRPRSSTRKTLRRQRKADRHRRLRTCNADESMWSHSKRNMKNNENTIILSIYDTGRTQSRVSHNTDLKAGPLLRAPGRFA